MSTDSIRDHESKVRGLFDEKAAAWSRKYTGILKHRLNLFIVELSSLCDRGARILDYGCGNGIYVVELAGRGYKLTGVDISEEMIAQAKQNLRKANAVAELHCGRLANAHDEIGPVDAIICSSVLEYVPDLDACLREFAQILVDEGLILLSVPNRESVQRRREAILRLSLPILQPLSVFPKIRGYLRYLEVSVNQFDPGKLSVLASRTGFQLVRWFYFDAATGHCDKRSRLTSSMLFAVFRKTS